MKRKILAMLAVASLTASITPVMQAKAEETAQENTVEEGTETVETTERGATEIENGMCGENVSYTLTADGTLTISGSGDMYDYEFLLNPSPFSTNSNIKKIVIENGVTGIGKWAFYNGSLTSVTIPESVTNIGDAAFWQCGSLTSVTIPGSVTSIGDSAFWRCKNLTSITFSEGIKSIGYGAFSDCSNLTSIVIPNSVTEIQEAAFASCSITSITIPQNVASIEPGAFGLCRNLTDIIVAPENTHYTSVNGALYNKDLTELLRYPADETEAVILPSVTTIADCAFNGSEVLKEVKIPKGVIKIGDAAFSGCPELRVVEIPSGVTSIGDMAFSVCNNLKSVVIPSSVTSMGIQVFGKSIPEELTVYCCLGSTAEVYAKEHNINYTLLNNTDELRFYDSNGDMITNEFVFDGSYTYFMQADGTPMRDRLTYHPDGEHIIYLDTNGHEVFNDFQYCPSVGYTCYFDSNGYIYKDQITFVGDKTYYLNLNGKLENEGWFQFGNGMDYGYANWDGTLNTGGFSYDPWGRVVFYHWNGMVARGLITDGQWYYLMDETDGHYLGSFPVN